MERFESKLIQSKIVAFDASINIEDETNLEIESQFSASIHEPIDSSDSTAMVKVKCLLRDSTDSLLKINCTAEMIFEFSPIPKSIEEYTDALKVHYRGEIQDDVMKKITDALNAMGHNVRFNKIDG